MSASVQARTVEEIRATGAAWVTESELSRLCDAAVRLAEVEKERDQAIAHDRQPYPTAWAYEQACAALQAAEADRDRYEELYEAARDVLAGLPAMRRLRKAVAALDPEQQP